MSSWKKYKHVGVGHGAHLHPISGKKFLGPWQVLRPLRLMHLHGGCTHSGGGIQQEARLNVPRACFPGPNRCWTNLHVEVGRIQWPLGQTPGQQTFRGWVPAVCICQDVDITVKCGDLDKTFKVAAWQTQRKLQSLCSKDKSAGPHIAPGRIARDPAAASEIPKKSVLNAFAEEKFEVKFKAKSDKSLLSFESPMGHCAFGFPLHCCGFVKVWTLAR